MTPDTCGCCDPSQPIAIDNRPGLSAIAYRLGTFASFKQALLQAIAGTPELARLSTRLSDDYAITVLELWATVADILTFYQERIANEGFLRTARDRDAVLRLARLLDYQLRPGVAATALLAFTLEQDAVVHISARLKVQSVPGEGEQPQKFETLEELTANARLNRLRIFPAPVGSNPLAYGSTAALLAPGEASLAAVRSLAPGERVVLFIRDKDDVEELTIRELRSEAGQSVVAWDGPVRGQWRETAQAYKYTRRFSLFGHGIPSTYVEPTADMSGTVTGWTLSTSDFTYTGGDTLVLDRVYEGLAVGAHLLIVISTPGAGIRQVIVQSVEQKTETLGPVSERVTRLTFAPSIGTPNVDRRQIVIYELAGPPLPLWGYAYPAAITAGTVYLPGQRAAADRLEVGRTIEGQTYRPGVAIGSHDVAVGRRILLADATHAAVGAVITGASVPADHFVFGPTPADSTTVYQLGLDPEQAEVVTAGIVSAPLVPFPVLSNFSPSLSVTIGAIGPVVVTLPTIARESLEQCASQLFSELRDVLRPNAPPEFEQAMIMDEGNRILVLPGVIGAPVTFGPTVNDQTTVVELGLTPDRTQAVTALASARLVPFPTITQAQPELAVSIGPITAHTLPLNDPSVGPIHRIDEAHDQLERALIRADIAPDLRWSRVFIIDDRLLVLPGIIGAERQRYLRLDFQANAPIYLDAQTAVLLGNVALASHGETVGGEVMGDGDAAMAFQRFFLKKKPLTFVPSAAPGGVTDSLEVSVNRVRWREVPSLYGHTTADQVYTTRIADDGTMALQFGDGQTGARLPSGRGNIVATYRQGLGLAGRVRADSLTTLLDRPVGLKAVTNPAAAEGGADPETLDQARHNAPTTVQTFGRAVSLRDFANLITASGEVAKASATWVWHGEARVVHVTVAGQQGSTFSPEALQRLHASLTAQRDPNHTLFLGNFERVPIVVTATLHVAATNVAADVATAARLALLQALSFEVLQFGQPVHLSDVYRVLQEVPGVVWVDIDLLHFKDRSPAQLAVRGATDEPVQGHLRLYPARANPNPPPLVLPAEQAWIEVPTQDITLVTSGGLPA
jgi:hypothetical protein